MSSALTIDIWSDVVCPWCYIGKRRLELALEKLEETEHVEVDIRFHSFELDPAAARVREGTTAQLLAKKFGRPVAQIEQMWKQMATSAAAEGLTMNFAESKLTNTFDAHRLLHLAESLGKQLELSDRLFKANFTDGVSVGDKDELVRLAAEVGIDPERARATVFSDEFAENVRADEENAKALGITGVPFFVFGEKYAVSGAQSPQVLQQILEKTLAEQKPQAAPAADACDGEVCR